MTEPPSCADPPSLLGADARRVLRAILDTFLPALPPEAGDNPTLFHLSATSLGVPEAAEQTLARLPAGEQRRLDLFLRLLNHPLAGLLLAGTSRRFTALPQPERQRILLALRDSRLPRLRTVYQGLKRLATYLFYSVPATEGGPNPAAVALGYTPPRTGPPGPAPLVLTRLTRATTLDADVCVIGSGAGGSVVAAELAAAGRRVIVLEAGSGAQAPDFPRSEWAGLEQLYLNRGTLATSDLGVCILAGAALGGGTAVNWQIALRTPDEVRAEWAELSGCRHFAGDSFTRSLDAVTARLGVGTGESVVNGNNARLAQGCEALGWPWQLLPRNAHGCDPEECGWCIFGCRRGGKQSAAVTYLRDAQRQGNTAILPDCRARRVHLDNGRVNGVEATITDPTSGRQHTVTVRARRVVLAAGALHSPVLLWRSGLGLPALGRHLYLHPTTAVLGVYEDVVDPWRGPPSTVLCDRFAALAGPYGVRLEAAPVHPGLGALATPWPGARAHRRHMQQLRNTAWTIVLTRDQTTGRVRVGDGGHPVIDYRPGAQEQAHLRLGIAAAVRVHLAAGARKVVLLASNGLSLGREDVRRDLALKALERRLRQWPIADNWWGLFSAHQMGTCRMGRDARTAVCDAGGEVFSVRGLFVADSSAFPASSGVNPMITIMALAHHTAQAIKQA